MLYRILVVLFLTGTTANLLAQSNVSFETYFSTYDTSNSLPVAGDFNNDGKPDLIQCCGANSQLVFRAGNGDGTFQAPVVASSGPVAVQSLVAADVNGDGNLDLVGVADINPPAPPASGLYQLVLWLGNGSGTFQPPQTYSTTQAPGYVVTGNFFNDGHPDIAVGEAYGNIDFFRDESSGGDLTVVKSVNVAGNANPQLLQVAAGDLNGNGLSDVVTWNYVLWNDGNGNFTQESWPMGGHGPYLHFVVTSLNGSAQKAILASYLCGNYCIGFDAYYGQGNDKLYMRHLVTSQDVETSIVGQTGGVAQIAGADVNGDGYGDIVGIGVTQCSTSGCGSGAGSTGLFVWLGNADGSFQQTPERFYTTGSDQVGPAAMADFTRNGMMDFAEAVPGSGKTAFYINATQRSACGTYAIDPSVTVCQPVDNSYSPSPVQVHATSFDTTPVTAMQEYVGNELVYSQPVISFDTTFSESPGKHFFVTKAWDASGQSFRADRTVTVYKGTPGPTCPAAPDTANICFPSGATATSPVLILANGDTQTSVPTAAQLYIDGILVVNEPGGTSYVQITRNLAGGTHNLVFKLWTSDGNVYTAQKTVVVN